MTDEQLADLRARISDDIIAHEITGNGKMRRVQNMRDIEKAARKAIRRLESPGLIGREERLDIAILISRLIEKETATEKPE